MQPGYMLGWFHNDIGGNFIIDSKTGDVTAFIDWDKVSFTDMRTDMYRTMHHWAHMGYGDFVTDIMYWYGRIWAENAARRGGKK